SSTDVWIKWFNICHVCLMISAAVLLLVAVMLKHILSLLIWMGLFAVHIIAYYIVFHAIVNVRNPFFGDALAGSIYVGVILLTLEGITQVLLRLMPEFLTIIGVSFLLIALFLDFIHLILITLTFEVTQTLYQLLYSIIATTLDINVTVNLGVYSIGAYWCLIIGWIAEVTLTILQVVPDVLTVVASFVLLAALISQCLPLFWGPLFLQVVQASYLVIFSIISSAMGKNLIVNQSVWHNVTFWLYVVIWLEILDVFWGVLHFVAANCLSLSLLMKSATPILVYIVTEALFLAFTIIYVPLSTAMGSNRQVTRHPEHCVLYWIFVCMTV
ncbi:Hypothetical predicted protein, partial [Drosophila guanche]